MEGGGEEEEDREEDVTRRLGCSAGALSLLIHMLHCLPVLHYPCPTWRVVESWLLEREELGVLVRKVNDLLDQRHICVQTHGQLAVLSIRAVPAAAVLPLLPPRPAPAPPPTPPPPRASPAFSPPQQLTDVRAKVNAADKGDQVSLSLSKPSTRRTS